MNACKTSARTLLKIFAVFALAGFVLSLGVRWVVREDAGACEDGSHDIEAAVSQSFAMSVQNVSHASHDQLVIGVAADDILLNANRPRPRAVIRTETRAGMAPLLVHVHALESQLGAGDWLTAEVGWDFGDSGSSFNVLEGFNAAHVYDEPGDYTITMRLMNEAGQVDIDRVRVRVDRARRRGIFVSMSGNDRHDGLTPDMPVRSIQRAVALMRDDTVVYFKRGEVFPVRSGVEIGWRNWVFSAYGTGDLPVLQWTGQPGFGSIISMEASSSDGVVIEDLHFNSNMPNFAERNICDAVVPGGNNIVIRNCRFEHVSIAVNANRQPRGLLTVSNIAQDLRAYFVWGEGTDHVHLGNTVHGSKFEHNMRFAGVERVLVAQNTLTNEPKRCIWAMTGEFMYITQNVLIDGGLAIGPNHAEGPAAERLRWCVAASNSIRKRIAPTPSVQIPAGAEHVMLRNNVVEAGGGTAFDIQGHHAKFDRKVRDLRIVHNTAINQLRLGRFVHCEAGNSEIQIVNNLYVAPLLEPGQELTAFMFVLDEDLRSFKEIRGNVWPVPAKAHWVEGARHYVWKVWSNAQGYRTEQEWRSMRGVEDDRTCAIELDAFDQPMSCLTELRTARSAVGVFGDRYGRRRPLGDWCTVGAVELNGADE